MCWGARRDGSPEGIPAHHPQAPLLPDCPIPICQGLEAPQRAAWPISSGSAGSVPGLRPSPCPLWVHVTGRRRWVLGLPWRWMSQMEALGMSAGWASFLNPRPPPFPHLPACLLPAPAHLSNKQSFQTAAHTVDWHRGRQAGASGLSPLRGQRRGSTHTQSHCEGPC